ncbi:hypothetical protein FRB97_003753 [Tulasnella sp. 331]|nr:hypothetical protein FRB97_003753 [Tulasnella sp. 331]
MEENVDEMNSEWSRLNDADQETARARNELFARLIKQNKELRQENLDLDEDHRGRKLRNLELMNEIELLSARVQDLQLSLKQYEEDTIAVCLIDGDSAVFSHDLLQRGQDGGAEAARRLKDGLLKHINENHGIKPRETKAMIFMNVFGLGLTLERNGICHSHIFRQFVLGFNQATPLFSIVDVGNGKEAADAKLRESLLLFSRIRQTRYIFFAGTNDGGYIPTLKSMQNEGNIRKMTILEGCARAAFESKRFIEEARIRMMRIPGLFRQERLEDLQAYLLNASRNNVISPMLGSSATTSEAGDVTPSEQGGSQGRLDIGKQTFYINDKKTTFLTLAHQGFLLSV